MRMHIGKEGLMFLARRDHRRLFHPVAETETETTHRIVAAEADQTRDRR